jgi:hypothetical protein
MTPKASGEESRRNAVALQTIEAQPSFGQIKPKRGRVVRAPNSLLGEAVTTRRRLAQEIRHSRRRETSAGAGKGGLRFVATSDRAPTLDGRDVIVGSETERLGL